MTPFEERHVKRTFWVDLGLPYVDAQPALAAAIVIDHRADDAAHLTPIVVIDYYRDPTE
ncbi:MULTISPECIES: hypothetical protein [unclassified Variovorax]|uniref:hypothetical protein n=1 Tax=unclassified Variovorax TaxID=663243 RepID=UPI000A3DE941|nr:MULTISPECIES: hypothetical protein [unclassified Variovorax]PNG56511.1 hypothetical protein CHC07_02928 [Variovorax sp. B4]PNG57935.1 hypothetical protein CHC06_02931 [Variovorax sp. B2]VTV09601.1 hypothetical protein WDL1CHR_00695 [Variovorax sp. WDL1]